MTSWPLPVASFWAGEDLSFVEQMVIRSYLDRGAEFTLYLGHAVGGIPDGVRIEDAATILPRPGFVPDGPDRKQLAVWSDLFRVALLRQRRVIWVDMDAYCVAPFDLREGYALGLNDEGTVLSGVMAMPPGSAALSFMADALSRDRFEPPWADEAWLARKRRQGKLGPQDLPWGDTGPRLLSHALRESGEIAHAAPPQVFYPLFRASLPLLWRPNVPEALIQQPGTWSVHIFGYTKRYLWTHHRGLPPADSWLARAAARHGVDPAGAPAKGEPLA